MLLIISLLILYYWRYWKKGLKTKDLDKKMNKKFLLWVTYDLLKDGGWVFGLLLLFFLYAFSFFLFLELAQWKNIAVFINIWPSFIFAFFPIKITIKQLYEFYLNKRKKEKKWKIYPDDYSITKLNAELNEAKRFLKKINKTENPNFYKKEKEKIAKMEDNINTYIKFNEIKSSILKSKKIKKTL